MAATKIHGSMIDSDAGSASAACTAIGALSAPNNLSDIASAVTARTNLGLDPFLANGLAYANILINGCMEISQENGTTAQTATAKYLADQWYQEFSFEGAISGVQVTDAPSGYANSIKLTFTAADTSIGAGNIVSLVTKLEGTRVARLAFGTADAMTATIGFWVKSSVTGTFGVSLQNDAANQVFLASVTINSADTWEWKTVAVSARTSGTWPTGAVHGMTLRITPVCGSTYAGSAGWGTSDLRGITGQTNFANTINTTFQITGVVLLPDTIPISSANAVKIQRHFVDELFLCRRYFMKTTVVARTAGTTSGTLGIYIPIMMRTGPTSALSSINYIVNSSAAAIGVTSADYVSVVWTSGNNTTHSVLDFVLSSNARM